MAANAQPWSGILSSSRAVDWTNVGIPGGIPNRTTICATLNPGATATQINSAIASCPAGQVVFLNAGTYNLSSGILFSNKSNVTLRGAGADQTKLVFTGGVSCFGPSADICIRNGESSYASSPAYTANWTAGFAKGTTQITVSSTTGMTVGNYLALDQADDSNTDTGTIWVCQTLGVCSNDGPSGSGAPGRIQSQRVKIITINGSTVTISPPVAMPNWRTSQSPRAWGANTNIRMSGVENLSIDHSNSTAQGGIILFNAYNCWVKGIRSTNGDRNHVWIWEAAASVVRDSYFYGTQNAASQSYGVELYHGSDILVENNIFQHVTSPLLVHGGGTGSVYGYNFAIDDYWNFATSLAGMVWLHSGGIDNILFEGNDGPAFFSDVIHGTHHFVTTFRNRWLGWEIGKIQQTNPMIFKAFSRYMNVIGNVLGRPGYHNSYQKLAPASGSTDLSIFEIGYGDGTPVDTLVASTLMRWGNYDTVDNAVLWNSAEVPSGLSDYANAVPANHNLPLSFYLPAKPSWWGTMPWPPIGPDVTGGFEASGHVYKIPARLCYENTLKDVGGILIFNALNCYTQQLSPTPGSPTGLTVQ